MLELYLVSIFLTHQPLCQVLPSHYDLFIQTNLTERTFNGYANIEMNVVSSKAQHVTLHAHPDLALHSLSISNGVESCSIPSSSISRDEDQERFSFPIPNALESRKGDKLKLQIAWKANLSSLATVSPIPGLKLNRDS